MHMPPARLVERHRHPTMLLRQTPSPRHPLSKHRAAAARGQQPAAAQQACQPTGAPLMRRARCCAAGEAPPAGLMGRQGCPAAGAARGGRAAQAGRQGQGVPCCEVKAQMACGTSAGSARLVSSSPCFRLDSLMMCNCCCCKLPCAALPHPAFPARLIPPAPTSPPVPVLPACRDCERRHRRRQRAGAIHAGAAVGRAVAQLKLLLLSGANAKGVGQLAARCMLLSALQGWCPFRARSCLACLFVFRAPGGTSWQQPLSMGSPLQ